MRLPDFTAPAGIVSGLYPAGGGRYDNRMTEPIPPLAFAPILIPKPWGGRRLADLGKPLPPAGRFGESWEITPLSVAGRGPSVAEGGPYHGRTLTGLAEELGEGLLGSSVAFPLLFKFLDAREDLSVQVHPDRDYAAGRQGITSKTESWYVMEAAAGSVIYRGLREGVSTAEVRAAAGTSRIVELLRAFPARPGDFHHLPGGTIHALGAGVMVAEPQTPGDVTFRLYDWTEEYDRPRRPLHTEQALRALRPDPPGGTYREPMTTWGERLLADGPSYRIREHRRREGTFRLEERGELRILAAMRGRARLEPPAAPPRDLPAGKTVLIPAASQVRAIAVGETTLLEISPAPPNPV